MPKCERCNKEVNTFTMSFFNEDILCVECNEIEKKHPNYEKAKKVEHEEVLKGNYNYEGIGLPENYDKFVSNLKLDNK